MNTTSLPPLAEDRVDAMERTIFHRISREARPRRARRTRVWSGVGIAASVLVFAAILAPGLTANLSGGASSSSAENVALPDTSGGARQDSAPTAESAPANGLRDVSGASAATDGREIVANGSATIEVDDVADAVSRISESAAAAGGYTESSQIGVGGGVLPLDGVATDSRPAQSPSSGWVSVRVPAEALATVMDGLAEVGTVTTSSVSRSDVTDQAIDLRARVAAGEASVARLTELITQASSVGDLIAAESALSERQAQLDADRQQRESLESQVALSTLSVQVEPRRESVVADPAGFGDGLRAGWNGLVATMNGIVVALGFLLPWLVVLGVAATVVWFVRRALRRRSRPRP